MEETHQPCTSVVGSFAAQAGDACRYSDRELWVDSQTFLPVRIFVDYYANQGTPSQDLKLTGNLTWLPRTESLVNMVNHVHIPAGFRQVAPPQ